MSKETNTPAIYPIRFIQVKNIDPSPANKRRIIDGGKSLVELADSIKAQGLLQAIVVRSGQKKNRFELVAGERRWRAFCLNGWKEIPAIVRTLTDAEAHEITTTENLQREDLSPIEESESIKVLLDDGLTAEEIADKLGKPVSWVARRARIADLSPKWREAITDETKPASKWSASHLELIARYDHEKQDELFESYSDDYDVVTMTVRELEKQLNADMLNLTGAPWKIKDETLLPEVGACTECQKRTSCAPSLFEPIEEESKAAKGDRCLDRECWGRKLVAHHEIKIKALREENPNLVLVNRANYNAQVLPRNNTFDIEDNYKYESAKKGEPEAIPAYVLDGPQTGKVVYLKMNEWYREKHMAKSEKTQEKGSNPGESKQKEREEALEKRRIVRFATKLMMILRNEDPFHTHDPEHEKDALEGDSRKNIAEKLSHIEVHALVAAFGAVQLDNYGEREWDNRWKVFNSVKLLNGQEALTDALFCVFDRLIDELRQQASSQKPEIEFCNSLCDALGLDKGAIWEQVLKEIPEPKSWAKAKASKKQAEASNSEDDEE